MDRTRCKMRVSDTASISDTKTMEIGMLSSVSFERYNVELSVFSNYFSNAEADTADEWIKSFSFA
jgi:hypothetical protein